MSVKRHFVSCRTSSLKLGFCINQHHCFFPIVFIFANFKNCLVIYQTDSSTTFTFKFSPLIILFSLKSLQLTKFKAKCYSYISLVFIREKCDEFLSLILVVSKLRKLAPYNLRRKNAKNFEIVPFST